MHKRHVHSHVCKYNMQAKPYGPFGAMGTTWPGFAWSIDSKHNGFIKGTPVDRCRNRGIGI